jgi:putative membrane protein
MSQKSRRVLVLSVDKDNDIGRVTGVSTPITGREMVASVATLFAIKSPEDSDINSIFAAINTYDSLVDEGFTVEVAVIAGTEEGGFKADLKIASDLDYILNKFKTDGVIFVSDGAADEQVIPTVQSKVPVISVKRVFVQQEKSVEETYVLFYRYIKKLAEPQHSKLALGVPGVLILATIVLYLANLLNYAAITVGIIIGAVLLLKGFNVDNAAKSAWSESPIRLITSLIGFMISVVAAYRGISLALIGANFSEELAKFVSLVLVNTIDLLVIGIAIYMGGRMVVKYLEDSPKLWHEIVGFVALVFIRQIVIDVAPIIADPTANLVPFIFTAGMGALVCAILVVVFTLTPRFRKRIQSRSSGAPQTTTEA